ncbi:MAG TPA: succinate--CoA ligase subunit alpha [Anaerolineae bacterium]|nr:succinate--CoA ligase subunit alpha [Anaerolineae bacterium]HOQ98732.1 succinate--CoA ligase subunit alpha [Anaerolineae bacterium]HPL28558.1 succinate--CoA ligase subunit alpha [Anaerolineae bacterium]
MAILVDRNTRLLVQGMTGREGAFHTQQMLAYGTNVVAGMTPGKGGQIVHGVPVYDTVRQAVRETGANASIIYVPAKAAADSILEAADAGLDLVVCITEGLPTLDTMRVCRLLAGGATRLVGPNCPGVISPGQAKVGIMPAAIHTPGPVGLVSRSGTLTYEVVHALTQAGLGQSTCVGIGGDPIIGTDFVAVLRLFEADPATQAVVLIGEIGGSDEERAAEFIGREMSKPVVAFVAGRSAPAGKRMGHAGAIISGGSGTAEEKIRALTAAGAQVAELPGDIPALVQQALR